MSIASFLLRFWVQSGGYLESSMLQLVLLTDIAWIDLALDQLRTVLEIELPPKGYKQLT
jgi:hypothetical protein